MKITSSREVYKCDLFSVTEDEAKAKDGFEMGRSGGSAPRFRGRNGGR